MKKGSAVRFRGSRTLNYRVEVVSLTEVGCLAFRKFCERDWLKGISVWMGDP